jgi:hypothetical protein
MILIILLDKALLASSRHAVRERAQANRNGRRRRVGFVTAKRDNPPQLVLAAKPRSTTSGSEDVGGIATVRAPSPGS